MTHVPQLVAERWHRKQRLVSDWSVPQFGQRQVAIDSSLRLERVVGVGLRAGVDGALHVKVDLRAGRHKRARRRVLLRDL